MRLFKGKASGDGYGYEEGVEDDGISVKSLFAIAMVELVVCAIWFATLTIVKVS